MNFSTTDFSSWASLSGGKCVNCILTLWHVWNITFIVCSKSTKRFLEIRILEFQFQNLIQFFTFIFFKRTLQENNNNCQNKRRDFHLRHELRNFFWVFRINSNMYINFVLSNFNENFLKTKYVPRKFYPNIYFVILLIIFLQFISVRVELRTIFQRKWK